MYRNIIRMMSFTIYDPDNEPITIEKNKNSSNVKVSWKSATRVIQYGWRVTHDNTELVRSFSIGNLHGIQLNLNGELVELLHEETDIIEFNDPKGYPVRFEISGPTGQRRLYVTWEYAKGYNRVTSTSVRNDVTTADCKYIKILCDPQDPPHGVLVEIKGQRVEVGQKRSSWAEDHDQKTDKCYRNYMWQEIKTALDIESDTGASLRLLELARLADILRGKDVLQLAQDIDSLKLECDSLKSQLQTTRNVADEHRENSNRLVAELQTTRLELEKLQGERTTFKQDLVGKLQNVLGSF